MQGLHFFRSANVQAIDVPLRGTAEYVTAVMGGHIMAALGDFAGLDTHFRAGTLKPVVVFTNQRIEKLPEVPTSKEKGYPDLSALGVSLYIAIHRDTPSNRIKKLHDALWKVAKDPEFIKILDDMDLKSAYFPPEVVEEKISRMEEMGLPLLKELKLVIE